MSLSWLGRSGLRRSRGAFSEPPCSNRTGKYIHENYYHFGIIFDLVEKILNLFPGIHFGKKHYK